MPHRISRDRSPSVEESARSDQSGPRAEGGNSPHRAPERRDRRLRQLHQSGLDGRSRRQSPHASDELLAPFHECIQWHRVQSLQHEPYVGCPDVEARPRRLTPVSSPARDADVVSPDHFSRLDRFVDGVRRRESSGTARARRRGPAAVIRRRRQRLRRRRHRVSETNRVVHVDDRVRAPARHPAPDAAAAPRPSRGPLRLCAERAKGRAPLVEVPIGPRRRPRQVDRGRAIGGGRVRGGADDDAEGGEVRGAAARSAARSPARTD
jgi:hypothetical protein